MSTTVTLEYPFEFEGQTIKTLSLRRPTVGDNLAVQKAAATDAEREIRLLANLAEVAPEALHRMDLKDYGKLQTTLASFLS
jgi:hypothetical protein